MHGLVRINSFYLLYLGNLGLDMLSSRGGPAPTGDFLTEMRAGHRSESDCTSVIVECRIFIFRTPKEGSAKLWRRQSGMA